MRSGSLLLRLHRRKLRERKRKKSQSIDHSTYSIIMSDHQHDDQTRNIQDPKPTESRVSTIKLYISMVDVEVACPGPWLVRNASLKRLNASLTGRRRRAHALCVERGFGLGGDAFWM